MEKPWKAVVVPWSQWGGTHTCGFVWAVVIKNQLFLPSNPQYELASPCLGTHAQKPWLWGCSRMENKVGSHKNRGAHSWRLRSSCFPLRSSRTKFRLGLNGAPQVEIWPPVFVNPGVNAALDLPIIFTVIIIPHLFHGFPEADGFSSCLWSQHKSLSCAGGWGFPVPLWTLEQGRMGSSRAPNLSPYWQKKLLNFWSIITNYMKGGQKKTLSSWVWRFSFLIFMFWVLIFTGRFWMGLLHHYWNNLILFPS